MTSSVRKLVNLLSRHRRAALAAQLAGPLGWISLIYLGSLLVLLLHAFWVKDSFTGKVEPFTWTLSAVQQVLGNPVYLTIALRTIAIAAVVTITDALLALPIAYYMARVASPRKRALLLVGITMPLWASYLVKVYAWRTILQGNGLLSWLLGPLGVEGPGLSELWSTWLVLS